MDAIIRTGKLEIDLHRFELRHAGRLLPVEPRVFDFVHYLAQHRERVITKAELVNQVWHGAHVTDSALARCASIARKALGDPSLIATVHRRGYRWAGTDSQS
jgi:DNA-binding winged helix-turn-helix (wHTH) protein